MNSSTAPMAEIFKFSEADLEANRQGTMTERQVKKLYLERNARYVGLLLILLAALVFWLLLDSANSYDAIVRRAPNPLFALVIIFVAGVSSVDTIKQAQKLDRVASRRSVERVASTLRLNSQNSKANVMYFLQLERFQMAISSDTYNQLKSFADNTMYLWYFAEGTKVILSVEKRGW